MAIRFTLAGEPSSTTEKQGTEVKESSFSPGKKIAVYTSIGLGICAFNLVALKGLSNLMRAEKPEVEKPALIPQQPSYLARAQQQGLVLIKADGPRLADIVSGIQFKLSPKDLNQAVNIISLKAQNGFSVNTNSSGVVFQPLSSAKPQEGGVTIAFLKPTDPAILQELKKHYPTIEISPADLANKDALDFKGHLAKTGGTTPNPEDFKIRQLVGGAVELRIKNIYDGKISNSPSLFQASQEMIGFLRESIGATTFSKQIAIAGTHSDIATKITGGKTENSRYLGKLLEVKVPNLVAGQEFTIPVTPVFTENSGKDLVIYFGNVTDLENFKTRFFPK